MSPAFGWYPCGAPFVVSPGDGVNIFSVSAKSDISTVKGKRDAKSLAVGLS